MANNGLIEKFPIAGEKNVVIRYCRPSDYEGLINLIRCFRRDPKNKKGETGGRISARMRQWWECRLKPSELRKRVLLVAEIESAIVGVVVVEPTTRTKLLDYAQWWVARLNVMPQLCGAGIGGKLFNAGITQAHKKRAVKKIGLMVIQANRHARRIYEKAGFKAVGFLRKKRVWRGHLRRQLQMVKVYQ